MSDSGFTMKGDIDMAGNPLIGLEANPTEDLSAVNRKWTEDTFAKKSEALKPSGFTMNGVVITGGNKIYILDANPSEDCSAVRKKWTDAEKRWDYAW